MMKGLLKKLAKMMARPLVALENKKVAIVVKLFLILYAATVAPKLPNFMVKLLKNPFVKLFVLFMIVFTGIKDPVMSLLIAVGFVISMMTLNKLETVNNLDDIIQGVVDVPQSLFNQTLDGAQELLKDGSEIIGSPVKEVAGVANKLVDVAQDVANKVVDGVQSLVPKVGDAKENFSMEDRTLDVEVPEMGNLDGLMGYSGAEVGADVEMKEPEALKQ